MSTVDMKTSGNKGFTLIEVIAVLIVLGILAAIAVSRVSSNQSDLIPQTDIAKSHLRFAQLKALADDVYDSGGGVIVASTWGITFTSGNPASYTLQNNGVTASINLPGEDGKIHTFPTGVSVATTTVTFDSWGRPVVSSVDLTPLTVNAPIVLSQGGVPSTINVTINTGYIP
jgi:prepilin-type N-terminal cleavage/methylation domain-containing protein